MLPVLLVAALLSPQEASEDTSANTLVWYDFEDDDLESGPTTFMVFEGAQGSVNLSSAYRYSGYRSVEIRDIANDGEFAELQGFFKSKWRGYLYIHFAMLIAEPEEVMNIAFAGRSHFSMREHRLQDQGLDTVEANEKLGFPADKRDYGIGAQILRDLGLRQIRILTNNPKKISRLEVYGLDVTEQLPIQIKSNPHNRRYLQTKREKLGHLLDEE